MAESGFFRIGFRGFKKQDVLAYIEEMQTSAAQRLAQAEEQRREAEALSAQQAAQLRTAQQAVGEAQQRAQDLQDQVEKLTALAQLYKRELLQLREQNAACEEASAETSALDIANDKIAHLEERCAMLVEQNARYACIVGDVNRIVVEARVIAESYLDAAQKKSSDCLHHVDSVLDDLKVQVQQASKLTEQRRLNGEEQLQTLLSDLQKLGGTIS